MSLLGTRWINYSNSCKCSTLFILRLIIGDCKRLVRTILWSVLQIMIILWHKIRGVCSPFIHNNIISSSILLYMAFSYKSKIASICPTLIFKRGHVRLPAPSSFEREKMNSSFMKNVKELFRYRKWKLFIMNRSDTVLLSRWKLRRYYKNKRLQLNL